MKFNSIFLRILGTSLLIIIGFSTLAFKKESAVAMKTVAITQIVEHPALDATYQGILDELRDQGYLPGKNIKLIHEIAQGSTIIAAQIAQKFVGLKPDVMVGIATLSAQSLVCANRNKQIPIVFASITDPVGAQLVACLENNEGSNVTGLSNWVELEPQLEKFKQILPGLKKLGFIFNPAEGNAVILLERLRVIGPKMGIEVFGAPATTSAEVGMATESIANKVDAIFISNDNTALSAFQSVVKAATFAGIPVFVSDNDMVESGAIAAIGPNQYQLGRQTGRMIAAMLSGTSPSSIPVEFPEKLEFYLNINAMAALNLEVSEQLKAQANKLIIK